MGGQGEAAGVPLEVVWEMAEVPIYRHMRQSLMDPWKSLLTLGASVVGDP